MRSIHLSLSLLATAFLSSVSTSPLEDPPAVISFSDLIPYTNSFMSNRTFPGSQLAVIKTDGQIMFEGVFGNLTYPGDPLNQPVTADLLYDIASLSKVVGATSAAMKLYEWGLLDLDAPWV